MHRLPSGRTRSRILPRIVAPPRALSLAALAAAAAMTLAAGAPGAQASPSQESSFQDDKLLVYNTPQVVAQTLDTLKSLGVTRIRVSVFWNVVAPQPTATQKPSFDASDPAAYPPAGWAPYDTLVREAKARGIGVYFDITSPAPYWATGQPPRQDIEKDYYPSPQEYGQFIRAIGKRYTGTYVPPVPSTPGAQGALPRVDYWSFWNEPNQPGWLTPQWIPDPHNARAQIQASPRIYRSLVDAGYSALSDTGHAQDTILVGETAPKGLNVQGLTRAIKPLAFIRLLYCLDDHYQPLTGQAAADQSCPTSAADSRSFPSAHPGLFKLTGWAHHPYELTFSPTTAPTDPDYVTIANLPKLTSALSTIFAAYGQSRPGGVPLYLTEFGYLTKPPSPLGVSLSQQSAYANQAEFITYNNPNVRTVTQFLLEDDKPKPGVRDPLLAYGGTFQTGLEFADGRKKPAYTAYRLPIFLPSSKIRRGHALRVWGLVRPAPSGASQRVAVQFRTRRSRKKGFKTLKMVGTQTTRAYLDARIHIPGTGSVRLAWTDPASHSVDYSRTVAVRVH